MKMGDDNVQEVEVIPTGSYRLERRIRGRRLSQR